MEAILMLVAQLAHRFGADPMTLLAILTLVFGFGIVGAGAVLVFYWLRSRIAIAERDALSTQAQRQAHIDAAVRRADNADQRLQVLMNGKLDGLTTVIADTRGALVTIKDSLLVLHDKEEVRAGKLYEKLDTIRLDIAQRSGGGGNGQ